MTTEQFSSINDRLGVALDNQVILGNKLNDLKDNVTTIRSLVNILTNELRDSKSEIESVRKELAEVKDLLRRKL